MRFAPLLSLALILGGGQAVHSGGSANEFLTTDLSGWEGLMEYWSYKDGVLVGATPKGLKFNTFLCSKRKYGDFEMSFQVRLKDAQGNSGVQIRSKLFDPKHFAVAGPQCDIGDIYWGSLYGEAFGGMMKQAPADLVKKVLKPKDFNDYHIKCVADHVIIKLNGHVTVDDVFPKMPREGIIAWQLHAGGPMEVTFKNVRFKDLSTRIATEKIPVPKEVVQPGNGKVTQTPTEKIPAPKKAGQTGKGGSPSPGQATPGDQPVQVEYYEAPTRRGLLPRLRSRLRSRR